MTHSSSDSSIFTASTASAAFSEHKHIPITISSSRHTNGPSLQSASKDTFSGSSMGIATRRSKRNRPLRSEDEESDEEYKEASSDEERRKRRRSMPGPNPNLGGGLVRSQSHPHNLHNSTNSDMSRLLAVAAAAEAPAAISAQQLQYQQMLLTASNQLAHLGFGPSATGSPDSAGSSPFYGMSPLFPFMTPHPLAMVNPFAAAAAKFPPVSPSSPSSTSSGSPTQAPNFFNQGPGWFDANAFMVAAATLQQQQRVDFKPLSSSGGLSALAATAAAAPLAVSPSFPLRLNLIILDPMGVERPYADVIVNSTGHLVDFAAAATGTQDPSVEIFLENQQRFVPVDVILSVLSASDTPEAARTLRLRVQNQQRHLDAIKPEATPLAT